MTQTPNETPRSEVEFIKERSNFLRGTIADGLLDPITGSMAEDDQQLLKFHGLYQQDDRDLRVERQNQKLEPAWQFMIRARIPAGIMSPEQWLAMGDIARSHGDASLRLTTRQAIQFHGIIKRDLKQSMAAINAAMLDTIAACGDVNRNVMASPNALRSPVHARLAADATAVSEALLPASGAYFELWLDGKKVETQEQEPVYGATYLPRKFKIAFAVPPENDVDVFAHDLGFIAIEEDGELVGYNVTVGGGMGATHGREDTYPRLADVIGFCAADDVIDVARQVVMVQRDFGNRADRKRARLKYTIDDRGLEWFVTELQNRLAVKLSAARNFSFRRHTDAIGWARGDDERWHRTVFVENGRVTGPLLRALDQIAREIPATFILTPNQNLIIAGVAEIHKRKVDATLNLHTPSRLRASSMACVSLPSCPLGMAEAERYLPLLINKLETLFATHGREAADTVIRMTGCPNGCARPYVAEIALVGKSPGRYNLLLGGDGVGQRLATPYRDGLNEEAILAVLDELLGRWVADDRELRFGDFVHLLRIEEVAA